MTNIDHGTLTELPGLPHAAVSRWLAQTLPELGAGVDWTAEVITGGLSNVTYRLFLPNCNVILRRPPLGGGLPSAHDMEREHTVQSGLARTAAQVPEMLALCSDHSVLGATFYVMRDVPGQVLRSAADTRALEVDVRAAVSTELVHGLADLHAVNYTAAGLSEFGRPEGYCARQVRRWGQQWERSATRSLPDMDELLRRLADAIPLSSDSSVVHGDYKIDNTIMDLTGPAPRVAAILDWELATLGDPLADLGTLLTYWQDSSAPDGAAFQQITHLTVWEGFPTVDDLAQSYALRSGRDLTELNFYLALGAMKLAVILEGVHARFLGGQTIGSGHAAVADAVPVLTARGLGFLPHL